MTASYLQNNDYTPLQMRRPYQLNVNDVAQTVATLDSYWKQGAARVKAQYENIAGLNLLTDENKQVISDFLKSAREQMKKLSTQRLDDKNVQQQGIGLFSPFLDPNNTTYSNVLKESQVVSHLNSEEGIAESFRTKDGGKDYNPFSHENIKYQKAIISQLNTGDAWKAVANQLQTYVPNVDVAAEMTKIKKAVTERIRADYNISEDQWSIERITKEGIPEHILKSAIEEIGSPQLKAYLREQGRNDFYRRVLSDPNGVDNYYQQLGSKFFDEQVSDIKVQKALVERELFLLDKKDENYASASKYYQDLVSQYDQTLSILPSQKEKYLSSLTGLSNLRNISSAIGKIDNISQQMGINDIAKTFAYENIPEKDIYVNPVKVAFENLNFKREELNSEIYRWEQEQIRLSKEFRLKYEQDERKIKAESGEGSKMAGILGGGTYNQPLATTMTPAELEKIGAEAIDGAFGKLNNDAELTGSFMKSVIGDGGSFFSILQDNIKENIPIKDISGAEAMGVTDKLSSFIQHYVADKDLNYGILNIPKGSTAAQIKNVISNFTPSQINQFLPKILSGNREFVMKAIERYSGKAQAIEFRSILDDADTKRENFNAIVLPEIKRELGRFGKYIDGYGENDLRKAWERIPESEKVTYKRIKTTPSDSPYASPNTTFEIISKEEFLKGKNSIQGGTSISYISHEINYSDFKKIVTPIINRTIGNKVVNNYGKQETIVYTSKDINAGMHTRDFQELKTSLQIAGDKDGDRRTVLEKVESLGIFRGINVKTPNVNNKTATIDILVEDPKGELLSVEEIAQLKNIPIASASLNPKWNKTGSSLDTKKFYGAVLSGSYSNKIKENDGKPAYIKIMNNSTGADVNPLISTNIPLIRIPDNTQPMTVQQLLNFLASRYEYTSFADMQIKDPEKAQREVTVAMNFYENNRK